MKKQVTIIPADKLIIVDGIGYELEFSAPENIHAIQWQGNLGHCEYTDGSSNRELTVETYEVEIAPYVALWEAEKAKIEAEQAKAEAEYNKPENVAARAFQAAKAERASAVASITVEVDGMVFDGDEKAQERMARTVTAATATGASMDDTTTWVLNDNTVAQVTVRQLATALRKAGEAQTALWVIPYTANVNTTYTPSV